MQSLRSKARHTDSWSLGQAFDNHSPAESVHQCLIRKKEMSFSVERPAHPFLENPDSHEQRGHLPKIRFYGKVCLYEQKRIPEITLALPLFLCYYFYVVLWQYARRCMSWQIIVKCAAKVQLPA